MNETQYITCFAFFFFSFDGNVTSSFAFSAPSLYLGFALLFLDDFKLSSSSKWRAFSLKRGASLFSSLSLPR